MRSQSRLRHMEHATPCPCRHVATYCRHSDQSSNPTARSTYVGRIKPRSRRAKSEAIVAGIVERLCEAGKHALDKHASAVADADGFAKRAAVSGVQPAPPAQRGACKWAM